MNRFRSLLVLLATALAAGCGSDDARLTVLLKDAPTTNVGKAWVTVTDVNLVGANGTIRLGPNATDGSAKAVTVDLLTLAESTASLVEDEVVPKGTYTELRFVLSGGCILVNGQWYAASPNKDMDSACMSATGVLRMPSMGQSGLKVTMSGNSLDVGAGSKVLLVDFDVAQSFGIEAGASGAWVMHPVITGGDITLSGNVLATVALKSGVTIPSTATLSCTVSLTSTTDSTIVFSSTLTGGIGTAQFYPPGGPNGTPATYQAALNCTGATVSSTQSPLNPISVTAGQPTPVTFTITSVM